MIINDKRALAYTAKIEWVKPIEGADNIELVGVLGWTCIAKIGEFHAGDQCVYFEIDSKVPAADWSAFLESKHYKIKTMKLGKFGVFSQGLALPFDAFDNEELRMIQKTLTLGADEHIDVTELLGVTYSIEEDNKRKANASDPNAKYASMKARHKKFFSKKWVKKLMKHEWFRKFIFIFLGKKKDNPKSFPTNFPYVHKTDEERCLIGDTKIDTDQGRLRIADIVNKTLPVNVYSYNEKTNKIELKPIASYQKYAAEKKLIKVTFPYKCNKGIRNNSVTCSADHKFYTDRGYIKACELTTTDKVYMKSYTYSDTEIIEFLYGNILGDGHIYKENGRVRFSFGQGEKNKEYVDLLYRLYNGGYYISEANGFNLNKTNYKFGLTDTDLLTYYLQEDNLFESNKRWKLTKEFLNRITAKSLALWYCDDGSFYENDNGSYAVNLHTESYSIEEQLMLKTMLKEKFNLDFNIRGLDSKYQYLGLVGDNKERFFDLIFEYIPTCLHYKLPEKYRSSTCKLMIKEFKKDFIMLPVPIRSIKTIERNWSIYDLEVADNHNFFANSILTHNCENMPWVLGYKSPLIVTEKLDGTSCTYIVERKKHGKFEFYVSSRNVRQLAPDQECYHETNIYWELAQKYNIEELLTAYLLQNVNADYVCIQGEGVGSVQGNPLKLKENDLYVFNFITSDRGRWPSNEGRDYLKALGFKWVPILDENFYMPNDMEEFKQMATAKSVVNPQVMREGIVLRDPKTDLSFKNVSREYSMRHNG